MDVPSLLRLIAEETRYGLLLRLQESPATVGELVEAISGEQTNVSHHLRTLRLAGLVQSRKEGRNQIYFLADVEVGRLLSRMQLVARQLERVSYTAALGIAPDASFHGYG